MECKSMEALHPENNSYILCFMTLELAMLSQAGYMRFLLSAQVSLVWTHALRYKTVKTIEACIATETCQISQSN